MLRVTINKKFETEIRIFETENKTLNYNIETLEVKQKPRCTLRKEANQRCINLIFLFWIVMNKLIFTNKTSLVLIS